MSSMMKSMIDSLAKVVIWVEFKGATQKAVPFVSFAELHTSLALISFFKRFSKVSRSAAFAESLGIIIYLVVLAPVAEEVDDEEVDDGEVDDEVDDIEVEDTLNDDEDDEDEDDEC